MKATTNGASEHAAPTSAPVDPHTAHAAALAAQLAAAEEGLCAAQVEARRAQAIADALRARDLEHCLGLGLVRQADADYRQAMATAGRSAHLLALARTAAIHATSARDDLAGQLERARREAELVGTRQDLADHLNAAELELAQAKHDTGRDAASRRQRAGHILKTVEEAIAVAVRAEPAHEVAP